MLCSNKKVVTLFRCFYFLTITIYAIFKKKLFIIFQHTKYHWYNKVFKNTLLLSQNCIHWNYTYFLIVLICFAFCFVISKRLSVSPSILFVFYQWLLIHFETKWICSHKLHLVNIQKWRGSKTFINLLLQIIVK